MDEEIFEQGNFDIENFMRPKCPVKIGDKFYKRGANYSLNPVIVVDIEESKDKSFYIITGKYENTVIGNPFQKFCSLILTDEDYVILRKGVDF